MNYQFRFHLLASVIFFTLVTAVLIIFNAENINILWFFLSLILGGIVLDADHLLYWFFLKPNTEESRLVKSALKNYDFIPVIKLIGVGRQKHHSLILHHYFFQTILVLFSFFIFTSTNNIFISGLILALNLHLIIDELIDYFHDPKLLQKWLFAREPNQLPVKFLNRYLIVFIIIFCLFTFLFLKTNI